MKKEYVNTLDINWQDRDIFVKNKMKNYGICAFDKQEIRVKARKYNRKHVNDTIIHELLHAILDEYDIHHKWMKEEELVKRLSKALIHVLEQIFPWINLYETLKK